MKRAPVWLCLSAAGGCGVPRQTRAPGTPWHGRARPASEWTKHMYTATCYLAQHQTHTCTLQHLTWHNSKTVTLGLLECVRGQTAQRGNTTVWCPLQGPQGPQLSEMLTLSGVLYRGLKGHRVFKERKDRRARDSLGQRFDYNVIILIKNCYSRVTWSVYKTFPHSWSTYVQCIGLFTLAVFF